MIKEISKGIYISSHSIYNIQSASGFITKEEKLTNIKVDNSKFGTTRKAVLWGEDNNHPQRILRDIRKTGVLGSALQVRTTAHFGSGMTLYKENEKGEKQTQSYRSVPEFKEFDKINNINRFYIDIIHDLEVHWIAFPEYVVSKDFSKINRVKRQATPFCRFEEMNKYTGRIENVYLNADWEAPNHEYTLKVPCFSFWDTAEDIKEYCKRKKIYKFIIPIHYTMDDEIYYPKPYYLAVVKNGWVLIAQSVPAVNKAIQENQLHVKFLISIAEEYFTSTYEDWDTFTPKEKKEKYEEVINKVDEHMSGIKAGGRSFTAPMYKDESGKLIKSIQIDIIDDKLKDGAFLPNATAANSEILFAAQVDPSLIGQGIPGGKSLSGSGSDKREAYTILCASLVTNRATTLLPFYFLRDWNGWGDDLDATFPNTSLTTLDKNPTGQATIIN